MADSGEFPLGGESTHVLRLLDAAARCSICYSIFDAPLSLRGCGHSFCSACIRQNLGFQEKTGDPQCPSCRTPCDARDLQPNVSLRELADKYNAARNEVIRLVLQEQEQKKIAASIAAGEAEAAPSRKKARMKGPVIVKNAVNAPRRSLRRSAAGRAKEKEAAQQKETTSAATGDDDSQPGPSTRNIRSRAQAKGESSAKTNKTNKEEMDIDDGNCIGILSEEEEEGKVKEEERTVDHDEDVDFTMESEEEEEGDEDGDDEFSPSPPLNKQRNLQQKQKQRPPSAGGDAEGRSKPAADAAGTPQGFVPCPICGKSVPSFYINSHVDTCLSSGGGLASGSRVGLGSSEELDPGVETNNQNTESPLIPPSDPDRSSAAIPTQNKSNLGYRKPPSSREGPYIPLAVPPSLVPSLASDKIIRAALKKYSLPSDGKKSEMFDRYSQFRTSVLTANDRQERTSYAKIAQEMAAQERQRAAAALLGGPGNGNNGKFGAGSTGGVFRQGNGNHRPSSALNYNNNKIGNGQKRGGDPMVLQGDSFEELIAVTKARDAARRAARAAAAAEEEEEEQEKVDRLNMLQQQDSPVYPAPTSPQFMEVSPSYQPIFPEEKAEEKEAAVTAVNGEDEKQAVHVTAAGDTGPAAAAATAAAAAYPDAVPNTREKMLAEEVRQAHEIGLLDSDDDNW